VVEEADWRKGGGRGDVEDRVKEKGMEGGDDPDNDSKEEEEE
jgi:hypothetical protein